MDDDDTSFYDAEPRIARSRLINAAAQLAACGLDQSAAWALDLVECLPATALASGGSDETGEDGGDFPSMPGGQSSYARNHGAQSGVASPWLPTTKSALSAMTPARPSHYANAGQSASMATPGYPMQSTPFLGIVAPSSSTIQSSSPVRPMLQPMSPSLERQQANLSVEQALQQNTPAPSELSASGRFPAPFRQPPSPLANLSYSAEAEESMHAEAGPSSRPAPSAQQGVNNESMQEDQAAEPGRDASSSAGLDAHSAHVRFASEGATSRSHSHLDEGPVIVGSINDPETGAYELALSCFRTGQLHRCRHVLERNRERIRMRYRREESTRCTFLRLYSGMLLCEGEAAGADDNTDAFGLVTQSSTHATSRSLIALLRDLVDPDDAFLLFLKGIIMRKLKKRIEAMDCLVRSLILFPYNWTAWLEFNAVIDTASGELEEIASLLPKSFMTLFWREYAERQAAAGKDPEANIDRIERLLEIFPDNAGLWNALGATRYMQQDFLAAVDAFERALSIDPFRAEGLADYSNALFLLERSDKLSELAHTVSAWGSAHPEACCVIGNHFYYQADHVRAIEAFKKAIKLDPGCVAAWILLGHAFIEMKNAGAASEMYRRAIDIHPRDYRPWHGLGKVYELLEGWSFAVHYYLKAAAIAPYTATVWSSLGHVYTRLGRYRNAISAHQRHLACEMGRDGGVGDVGGQLGSISAILALLDRCIVDADTELQRLDPQGEDESRDISQEGLNPSERSQRAAQLLRRRSDLEQEAGAWHCRAVMLLLRFSHEQVDASQMPANTTVDRSAENFNHGGQGPSAEDVQVWAESFVKAARNTAGLPLDFDPAHQGSMSSAAAGLPHDHDAAEWLAERGNVPLAKEYLTKVLDATSNLGNADGGATGREALDDSAEPPFAATGPEQWRYEARKLLRWLHAVNAL